MLNNFILIITPVSSFSLLYLIIILSLYISTLYCITSLQILTKKGNKQMKYRNRKSPVVMWNSKWIETGEMKVVANQLHQKSEVPVRILVEIPVNE